MATISNQKLWLITTSTMILLILQSSNGATVGSRRVPAMFVFGDSLVDVGNNNFLSSLAKANYYPYGCDFQGGRPTGRFTNGETLVDMLGRLLGIPYLPAFADPSTVGNRILNGVNYASAAAGILDETGQHYGERYSLSQQVLNFENTIPRLRLLMNGTSLDQYLAKSIAILVFGSNDYINNYLMPSLYPSTQKYNPPDFANFLLNRYTYQILALRSVGLRKFVLLGVGPLGCIPNQRASGQAPAGRCVDNVNEILGTFNEGLKSLVSQLNSNHPDAIFVYCNTYGVFGDILNNPATYGFSVIDRGCCGIQNLGQITCLPSLAPCLNRSQYVFWDAYHPTTVATAIVAWRVFSGSPSDAYPINVQQMSLI
ncbi:hypothetical protein CJ030_MR6G019610 [Morella rubra]|uniref:Uncharacterized protein n=1 Tax=Morella rubra TaxID=262757 RepID=A0A6A1VDQ9_9ROSI|nr:hypothetical protein CJ030_MR6G019610 [Morella rubra]